MEELQDKYVRFDWAIKRLLRQKANFDVLEGFLTVFLGEKVTILEILESESNQLSAEDKFNRVDIKARNSKDEIIIIEIQNTRELYYLERILYGVAKAITEHISLGETYYKVKKIYSISVLYFDIGKGNDYLCSTNHNSSCYKINTFSCIKHFCQIIHCCVRSSANATCSPSPSRPSAPRSAR